MPQRGSDRYNVHLDDEMKHELTGMLRGERPSRTEEWRRPEPDADDDPPLALRGRQDLMDREYEDESYRFELARHLRRTEFPTDRRHLMETLRAEHAPEDLVQSLAGLPEDRAFVNVQDVVAALGRKPRA
ncbi:DUF2795 domain-containing protein [Streptomyces sp. YIM 98790]|uniref:DUF2795 domain-containing protein n=1 Tax=Streptomyces sp. YIM 98790 TaxID=2689077 RepID=UPI00140AC170|nr:DUF2795 domain-containing protein [Streptomyces sp. YIM 98790]